MAQAAQATGFSVLYDVTSPENSPRQYQLHYRGHQILSGTRRECASALTAYGYILLHQVTEAPPGQPRELPFENKETMVDVLMYLEHNQKAVFDLMAVAVRDLHAEGHMHRVDADLAAAN